MWLALLALPLLWVSILFLLSSWSGWRTLARAYPAGGPVAGQAYTWRWARLGPVFYRYCLRFVAGPDGLRVAMHLPFRPGHPPFLVPWRDISAHPTTEWFIPLVALRLARHPEIRFLIGRELAGQLLSAAGGAVQVEPNGP